MPSSLVGSSAEKSLRGFPCSQDASRRGEGAPDVVQAGSATGEAMDSGWVWQTWQQPLPRGAGALDRNPQRGGRPEKANARLRPGWEPQWSLECSGEGLTPARVGWGGARTRPACRSLGRPEEHLHFRPLCSLWVGGEARTAGPRETHWGSGCHTICLCDLSPTLPQFPLCKLG